MIITQTPYRISLFGGGTDFPDYYKIYGGAVLATTINKFIYVIVQPRYDQKIRVGWTETQIVDHVDELKHALIREALKITCVENGIEIVTMGDLPAGSGLGSSSAVTVGVVNALSHYINETTSRMGLARIADIIERVLLEKPIGVQDQYMTALGGLRELRFLPDGQVATTLLDIPDKTIQQLDHNLLLFDTGIRRQAETILSDQVQRTTVNIPDLQAIQSLEALALDAIRKGDLDRVGRLLDHAWEYKKQLSPKITNPIIDSLYQEAKTAGALGGKLTGAGGGGFLLLYCPYEHQPRLRACLGNLKEIPFHFEAEGTKVIFNR